jgi:hypothetical protein
LDTDIVIGPNQRRAVHDTLVADGYEPDIAASTDLVMYQRSYRRSLLDGLTHTVDVHWRLANPEVFRQVLSFDEMLGNAVRVPQLGPAARGLCDVHALLVACVHRVAHHSDEPRLIWFYDIHLIASRLNLQLWQRFVDLAIDRQVLAICQAGLQRSVDHFGTYVPSFIWAKNRWEGPHREVTASYLVRNRSRARALVGDMRVLPSWGKRWQLLREYAFPPVEYMRKVYASRSSAPLFWLYAQRMLFGAHKWLVRLGYGP